MKCTWKNCHNIGEHSIKDKNGKEWACLCNEHNQKMQKAVDAGEVKLIISSWIKAKGGADLAAASIINRIGIEWNAQCSESKISEKISLPSKTQK